MFYDLCIDRTPDNLKLLSVSNAEGQGLELAFPSKKGLQTALDYLVEFGYDGMAHNISLPQSQLIKCPPREALFLPVSVSTRMAIHSQSAHKAAISALQVHPASEPFLQVTRLTILFDNPKQNLSIGASNPNTSSYDILAVQPLNEKAFQFACHHLEMDILSFDCSQRLDYHLKSTTLHLAIQRGIMIEITYSAAIQDVSCRRNLISNALNIIRATRGRNVILSSGARQAMLVRGPYDVINLASLFKMTHAAARECISKNPKQVLVHAATRLHTYRGVVSVENLDTPTSVDKDTAEPPKKKQKNI